MGAVRARKVASNEGFGIMSRVPSLSSPFLLGFDEIERALQFQRTFVLADGMEVSGADLKNGLLSIDLVRPEPERVVRSISIKEFD